MTKYICQQRRVQRHSQFTLGIVRARELKDIIQKILFPKRRQMESAVRKTLVLLLDRSKQFITRSLLLDRFT